MIRVYGFSLESDWRYDEPQEGFLKKRRTRLAGMEIWLPREWEDAAFFRFVKTHRIPVLGRWVKPEPRVRLAVTPATCAELEESGIFPEEMAADLRRFQRIYFEEEAPRFFEMGDSRWDLSRRTLIMAILNVTPDSFYDGGWFRSVDQAVRRASELAEAGADILDIGAESTRPGATPLTEAEELNRLLPVIEKIAGDVPLPISVDTYKAAVARETLRAGAVAVNDISGLRFDPNLAAVVAEAGVPVFLMHIQGTPRNMQKNPVYGNLMGEIVNSLAESRERALAAGISPQKIVVDPGIGFGKKWHQNYQILGELEALKMLEAPVLVGPSRKSFLGKVLDLPPQQRLEGTLVAAAVAIRNGAHFLRVHDPAEVRRAAKIAEVFAGKGPIPVD